MNKLFFLDSFQLFWFFVLKLGYARGGLWIQLKPTIEDNKLLRFGANLTLLTCADFYKYLKTVNINIDDPYT